MTHLCLGLQSAIPPTVFDFLHERFGCEWECFASPFNFWLEEKSDNLLGGGGQYGSAFGDTDAVFGSSGSFFDLDFLRLARESGSGCFQANPPFASVFIERMCHRMHHFLMMSNNEDDGADEDGSIALMFVIFVPAWSESSGWKTISSSSYLTRHVLLSQKDDVHYYAEGTQHRRALGDKGTHRIASFDTSVFFLQNDAAKDKWPIGDADESKLKTAFAMNPIEEDKKAERGGSDALKGKSLQSRMKEQSPPKQMQSTTERKKKKKIPSGDKSKRPSKNDKLMTGGQDELGILASMGMLGSGPSLDEKGNGDTHTSKNQPKPGLKGYLLGRKKKRRRR